LISTQVVANNYNGNINIPEGTYSFYITTNKGYCPRVYEIGPSNEPTFTTTNGYILLHADPTKAIRSPYQMVSISYFPTSIQRLYRIDETGTWQTYNDNPIKVDQGSVIYAKGIDKHGNETRIISSHTSNVPAAIQSPAYDGNNTTYSYGGNNVILNVDSSLRGKSVNVIMGIQLCKSSGSGGSTHTFNYLNSSGVLISTQVVANNYNGNINIPEGTYSFYITTNKGYCPRVYEIGPSNEPTFTTTNGYILLHADPTKAIRSPYQMVSISYFPTSIQRLYRIDETGTWQTYNDNPIKVDQGSVIYAKGIDKHGNETRIISSHTSNVPAAIQSPAYDGNNTTYSYGGNNVILNVDSSLRGKSVNVIMGIQLCKSSGSGGSTHTFNYLNSSGVLISTQVVANNYNGNINIPEGTYSFYITTNRGYCPRVYEIGT
ncbi:MAG: hypothetical protein WDA12_04510, partial [Bacilli bacterium]